MSAPSDHPIGYGRPPKAHQWKKGQSGNPTGRRPKAPESTLVLIDGLLAALVPIRFNGETKRVPAIEAIVLQLMQSAGSVGCRRHIATSDRSAGRH